MSMGRTDREEIAGSGVLTSWAAQDRGSYLRDHFHYHRGRSTDPTTVLPDNEEAVAAQTRLEAWRLATGRTEPAGETTGCWWDELPRTAGVRGVGVGWARTRPDLGLRLNLPRLHHAILGILDLAVQASTVVLVERMDLQSVASRSPSRPFSR